MSTGDQQNVLVLKNNHLILFSFASSSVLYKLRTLFLIFGVVRNDFF